jgi:hypothetical protein
MIYFIGAIMDEKRYCACGCGNEVTTWKNGTVSPFRRGHHMRKQGYKLPPVGRHFCQCGCGTEMPRLPNGHIRRFIWNHHRKGVSYTVEQRASRMRSRWKKEPIFSPYVPHAIVNFSTTMKRWTTCISKNNKRRKSVWHANAVYRYHFGDIPEGYVVHHKDGKHQKLTDDRPENLMILPDEWNLRFFPVLAKGFNVPEKVISDTFVSVFNTKLDSKELFVELCNKLVKDSWITTG